MKSPKDIALLALLLAVAGLGGLAWRQYSELVRLRVATMDAKERAEWQQRLWAAEKKRGDLEKQVAEHQAKVPDETPEPPPGQPPATAEQRRGRRGDRAAEFMAVMDKPEVQRLLALQQKGALDARYAALFRNLNLTPAQLDKFKNLLVEKQTSLMDVLAAAREQGINPRTDRQAFQQMIADAQSEIDGSIKSLLGDTAYSQYQNYEKTSAQRGTVGQLEQRLSYSSTPLTSTQSDQLVSILSATSGGRSSETGAARGAIFSAGIGGPAQTIIGGGTTRITDATVAQAQAVLTAPQLDALKELQAEQAAQAQLAHTMRSELGGPPPPPADTSSASGKPGGG